MRFRPLCVDYHSRAQEIIATDRDIHTRRMAALLLPNPSPLPCDSHPSYSQNSLSNDGDGIGLDGRPCDSCINDEEKRDENSARVNVNNDNDSNDNVNAGRPTDQADVRESIRSTRRANTDANSGCSTSRQRLKWCIDRLGPAIHPSECAFRPISPVTKGPVRGKLIPIAQPVSEPLGAITKLYSNLVERKLDVVIASLECAGSRFDSASDDILPFPSQKMMYRGIEHHNTSFIDTMRIEYGRDDYQDMTCLHDLDPEKENVLIKQIWTQHVNSMSMPKSIFLRQEPEDLDKIYSLKAHRFSDTTSFASDVTRSFRPALSALVGSGRVCDSFANDTERMLSIKPSFDANLHMMCPSLPLPPHDNDDYDDSAVGHVAYMEAMVENSARHNIIWLDPVFDPLHQLPPRNESTLKERLVSLNETCSARSISALLRLPGRFEETHDLSFCLPQTSHKLDYFSAIWTSFEESVIRESSMEWLLEIYGTRMDLQPTRPRKICFDADIEILTTELNDGDNRLMNTTTNRLISLNLPSFYEMCSSVRPTTSVTGGLSVGMKHFVESSARVSNMITLKNLVKSSNVTSIFLPQSIVVEKSLTVDKSTQPKPTSTVLLSAIRSIVRNDDQNNDARDIQFLQEQCSNYPIASWFLNERSDSTMASDDHLLIMRQMFCEDARAKSTDEGYRCLLLTGCSSKRNARGIYSYRGFLTNQIVDHQVFQRRYSTIVHMNKRQRNLTHDAFFTTMVLRVFVDAFARYKESNSNGRSAPYSIKLKTQRHGQLKLVVSRVNEKKLNSDMIGFATNIDRINEFILRHTSEVDADDSDEVCCAVEVVGKSSLKIRGELLHLLTKARELDDEKRTYLADLTVVNRSFAITGIVDADVGFDTAPTIALDLTVPEDRHRVKKRKSVSDPSLFDEENEKKKSKKKRKKDKKKKRKKEERKKKRQDDSALEEESKSCKVTVLITPREEEQQQSQQLSTMTSSKNVTRVANPSIPIGMTPIVRTKKIESLKKMPDSQREHLGQSVKEGMVYRPASSVETSPDSVADYYNDPTQLHRPNVADTGTGRDINCSSNTLHNVDQRRDSNMPTNKFTEVEQLMDIDMDNHHGEEQFYNERNDSSNSSIDGLTDAPSHDLLAQMHLLTSESFLETFSEVVAELACGRWMNTLTESEKKNSGILESSTTSRGAEIVVLDCPLLDITGVDIELSNDSAIIVQYLSSWAGGSSNNNPPNGRAVTHLFNDAMLKMVLLLYISLSSSISMTHSVMSESLLLLPFPLA